MAAPQYAILRFAKYKGPEISGIEAHNERTKEKYASNPDIDPSRTHLNFHLTAKVHVFVGSEENAAMQKSAVSIHHALRESLLQVLPKWHHGEFSINHGEDYANKVREIIGD